MKLFNINLLFGAFINFIYNEIITHIPMHSFRLGFLRLFNKQISKKSIILMHSKFLNFWKLEIEDRVIINQYCLLDCRKHKIHIANDSDIGAHTFIWTLGHDINNDNHDLYGGDVNIGHHVWIASRVTILPGLSIADGSVIASASVVTKNVEYLEVVAGNPAKVIKHRKNNLKYTITYQPFFE